MAETIACGQTLQFGLAPGTGKVPAPEGEQQLTLLLFLC
jgi:hypothetical protein